MGNSQRTVLICSAQAGMFERLVAQSGYEVVGVAEMAVQAEQLAKHLEPDMIVVENELTGITGVEALPILHAASPQSQVVLVVADDWQPTNIGDIGAYAVLRRSRLTELGAELNALDRWLSEQAANLGDRSENRKGRDRRKQQDWSKVGFEKRSGSDRRETDSPD